MSMEKLQKSIQQFERVAVAISGGSDSAIILREAAAAIGPNRVLAITAITGCLPRRRQYIAQRVAELAGVQHHEIAVDSLTDAELTANTPMRCVDCRRRVLQAVLDEAWLHGCDAVLDGRHNGDRTSPTFMVAEELTLFSPYCDCEMGEAQLRMLRGDTARHLPQDACLYSRFADGMPISQDIAFRIDRAEDALRNTGYEQIQIHMHGSMILVAPASVLEKAQSNWKSVVDSLQQAGLDTNPVCIQADDFFIR